MLFEQSMFSSEISLHYGGIIKEEMLCVVHTEAVTPPQLLH